jgi:hypothetical protein
LYKSLLSNSLIAAFAIVFVCALTSCQSGGEKNAKGTAADSSLADSAFAKEYDFRELRTDFSKHNVPLDSIRDGGVAKNTIPAIDYPEFFSLEQARGFLTEPDYGILLQGKTEVKFYPLNILNWHEIVNDEIDGVPVAVTFCPLCGSGMVYERVVDGDTLQFGVSGKLYESNLLMFDDSNESLWSQSMGEAVAGNFTGKKLKLINSNMVSYEDVSNHFPDAKVLSPKTGYDRNYTQYPYADYMSSEELYFPVSITDTRFPAKQMMYIVSTGKETVAFDWLSLLKKGAAILKTPSGTVVVKVVNNIPSSSMNGQPLPAYFSFWFSWYVHYGTENLVWTGK